MRQKCTCKNKAERCNNEVQGEREIKQKIPLNTKQSNTSLQTFIVRAKDGSFFLQGNL